MNKELEKELEMGGAKKKEISELISIVDKLSEFSKIERSFATKRKFLEEPIADKTFSLPFLPSLFWLPRQIRLLPGWALSLVISFVLVILVGTGSVWAAQESLPGEPLYRVKRLSENIVSSVKPEFKSQMLIRRSEEIKGLIEEKKDFGLLDQTVIEYKKEKREIEHNSSVLLKAERNLEQAQEKAQDEIKEKLKRALESEEREGKSGSSRIRGNSNKGEGGGDDKVDSSGKDSSGSENDFSGGNSGRSED